MFAWENKSGSAQERVMVWFGEVWGGRVGGRAWIQDTDPVRLKGEGKCLNKGKVKMGPFTRLDTL